MGKLGDLLQRLTGKDGRGEADPAGRTGEDDFTGETGAERRADPDDDAGRHRRS